VDTSTNSEVLRIIKRNLVSQTGGNDASEHEPARCKTLDAFLANPHRKLASAFSVIFIGL
jgi:hypothetical protein